MLHFIRERAQGWIAWFIVGLISIPFALWGINSYFNGPSDVVVAEVEGEAINQTTLQQFIQRYRDQMRSTLGAQFDPAMFEGNELKKEVLDTLIEQNLLIKVGQTSGQYISDQTISAIVRNTPAFQRDGQFDSEYYKMVLARAGYTPLSYEKQLRNDIEQRELLDAIQSTGNISKTDVENLIKIEKQTRTFSYGVISVSDFTSNVDVSDEQIQTYYDNNRDNYMSPEMMKVEYLQLSAEKLAEAIEVNETDLKQFYSENMSKFIGPEQRRASHILIEGDDQAALEKITEIRQQIMDGADFAELAKSESQDPGSADLGGDLGLFQKGVMDEAFENATYALNNIGDISEPVKTEFGYHLIKLTGIEAADTVPFSDVKQQVEALYRQQEAEKAFYDKAELLANLTYENPDNLEVASEALELNIQSLENLTRQGMPSGVASDPKFVNAAFSEDVLDENLNSAVIELSETDLVVLRKTAYQASALLPFESVSPAIRDILKFEKATQLAQERGQSLLADIKTGADVQSSFNNWYEEESYTRRSDKTSSQVLDHAFAMPKPRESKQYSGFTADNGNYIVVALTAVEEGQADDLTETDAETLQEELSRVYAESEARAFIAAVRAESDVEILVDELK